MILQQRDIIEVPFFDAGPHPAIVVSVPEIFEEEGFFYAVNLSTKNWYPDWTFPVTPDMINNPRNFKSGFAVCHIVQLYYADEVTNRSGSLKVEYFSQLIAKINRVIFTGIS
jgi:hypothetical protein